MIALAKAAADPAGHYARPDVTRLWLNKAPGDRIISGTPAEAGVTRMFEGDDAITAAVNSLPEDFAFVDTATRQHA